MSTATTIVPEICTEAHSVATPAAQLPQASQASSTKLVDVIMHIMVSQNQPLSDRELAALTQRHQSTVRGAREKLVDAGMLRHAGFKRFSDSRKAHMTWAVVCREHARYAKEALTKRVGDGLHKISCMKTRVSKGRHRLREIECASTKHARLHAMVAAE